MSRSARYDWPVLAVTARSRVTPVSIPGMSISPGEGPGSNWAPTPYLFRRAPRSPRRRGLALIIGGGAAAVLGVAGLLYIGTAVSTCNSGLGLLAQNASRQSAVWCREDNDFHSVSVAVLLTGLVLAMTGLVRLIMANGAAQVGRGGEIPGGQL